MEEPSGLQSMESLRVGDKWATSLSLSRIGEGNGNPLQWSCLENPRDRGAWRAAIYGVTQSWTRLKWFSSSSSSSRGCNELQPVNPKGNQSWIFIGKTDTEAEIPILWPPDVKNWLIWRLRCWERLKAGEGDDRGWDGWMASPTWCTWIWISSRRWWWTGNPGMMQFMGSQRVRHDGETELNRRILERVLKALWSGSYE